MARKSSELRVRNPVCTCFGGAKGRAHGKSKGEWQRCFRETPAATGLPVGARSSLLLHRSLQHVADSSRQVSRDVERPALSRSSRQHLPRLREVAPFTWPPTLVDTARMRDVLELNVSAVVFGWRSNRSELCFDLSESFQLRYGGPAPPECLRKFGVIRCDGRLSLFCTLSVLRRDRQS
jgi:hypothetical protein